MTQRAQAVWLPAVFGGAAFAWVIAATARWGPGVSNDGVTYLSVARNLAAGRGFVRFDGSTVEAWPPLYPGLLAIGTGVGLDPSEAARVVGALSAAAAVAALVALLLRATCSVGWATWGGVMAFASPALWRTFASAWSEAVLSALVVVACWLAGRRQERWFATALLLGAVAGLACLTRWIGIALVGAIALWFAGAPALAGVRWKRTILFLATAVLGPGLWGARNLVSAREPFGTRGGAYAEFGRNLVDYFDSLAATFGLDALSDSVPWIAGVFLLVVCGVALAAWARDRQLDAAVPVSAAFLLFYSLLLVGLASWTPVALLSRVRFGAPVWLPFVALLTVAAASCRGRLRVGVYGVAALLAALAIASAGTTLAGFRSSGVHGLGRAHWTTSGLLQALREDYSGSAVLSNRPHAVYHHTLVPAVYAPRRHHYRSLAIAAGGDVRALRQRLEREEEVSLAWFGKYLGGYGFYLPRELIEEGFCVRAVGRYNDGVLFRVSSESPCPSS